MPETYNMTSGEKLLDSVNVVLANLGEAPVNTIVGTTTTLPQQVSLALKTIQEVSNDVQSKGWWFNQTSTGTASGTYSVTENIKIHPMFISSQIREWSGDIPHEARRYITIRAARIAQTRLIGSEELQKFSYNEELVSLAVLQQAHVRNSNGVLDFNDFPAELKGLGVDEIMFLQGNVEEKIGTLRLGGELANTAKTKAETELLGKQKDKVEEEIDLLQQQFITEQQETIKRGAEAGLITNQQALVAQQVLDSIADVALKSKQGLKIDEETDLLQTQDLLTSAQKDTELQNAIKVAAESGLVTTQQALVAQQVLESVADVAVKGAQKLKIDEEKLLVTEQKALVTKQVITEVQNAIKVSADSGLVTAQQALVSQQVLDSVADVTLKGKQGSLVDAQAVTEAQNAIKVAADAGLVTAQQALIAQQTLDVSADTTLKGKQGSLVDAQTTTEGSQQTALGAQATKSTAEGTLATNQASLVSSQRSQLVLETAIGATVEKEFYDNGGVSINNIVKSYRDFAPEMRMMGIQEAQFQSTPAYKKVELIKDADKLRKQHTENNRYRMNTRVDRLDGGLYDFTVHGNKPKLQFYGLASATHTAKVNPITVPKLFTWQGFEDSGAVVSGVGNSGKFLADGNPKGFTISSTTFTDDGLGNSSNVIPPTDSVANRSFLKKYGVHVTRTQDIFTSSGRTYSASFWVDFKVVNPDALPIFLLEAIADDAVTVYIDGVQYGATNYIPYRWEDEDTLASSPINWDNPQRILLTSSTAITQGFHKITFEFTNQGNSGYKTNAPFPEYADGNTDNSLYESKANPVALAARLTVLKTLAVNSSGEFIDFYNNSNRSDSTNGTDGDAISIWDTTKQFQVGNYNESDIEVVNDVLRLIGEPPVKEFHENALAIETFNILRKTDLELQGRGWFFNTEKDILLGTDIGEINLNDNLNTSDPNYKKSFIQVNYGDFNKGGNPDTVLSFKANNYEAQLRRLHIDHPYRVLYNTKTRETYDWFPSKGVEGTAIVHKELATCPQKYIEYLTVRVATILTELYPQSGIDIQRLPKMEQELETYFKDIQSDQASYSVFDNYDTASRIGINRNYQLL